MIKIEHKSEKSSQVLIKQEHWNSVVQEKCNIHFQFNTHTLMIIWYTILINHLKGKMFSIWCF